MRQSRPILKNKQYVTKGAGGGGRGSFLLFHIVKFKTCVLNLKREKTVSKDFLLLLFSKIDTPKSDCLFYFF